MRNQTFLPIAVICCLLLAVTSCKKESKTVAPDPFYEVTVDGLTATFTNETTHATSYKWDFGDGTSSTDSSPVHTYPAKGKYVPTLYATGAGGVIKEASTVLHISKGSAIKMNDNSLADWDSVTYNVVIGGAGAGNFIKAKYDYDGNNVYVYFEQNAAKADGNIYDMYIDADNNYSTGYLTNDIPGGAYDVLLEGTVFDGWLDPYYFSGSDQNSFDGYLSASISDFYTVGDYQEAGGVLKFEFALKRSKIKNLTGTGLRIGVQVSSNDWSATIGYSPDVSAAAFYLDMSE